MSDQRPESLVEDPPLSDPFGVVRAFEIALMIVLAPPTLALAILVGIYAGAEWVVFRIHDALHPDRPILGRPIPSRFGLRIPASHDPILTEAGPLAVAAIPQGVVTPARPHRGEAQRNASRPPSAWT
jgi:hypothetical protein